MVGRCIYNLNSLGNKEISGDDVKKGVGSRSEVARISIMLVKRMGRKDEGRIDRKAKCRRI